MDKHSVAATKTYGTSRMDAYSILNTLNLKTVTMRTGLMTVMANIITKSIKNETMLARKSRT